jgi:ubiquinone/menaquinone biosynthesis C-methylase UbiE
LAQFGLASDPVNAAQVAEWNGALGERWAELQHYIDGLLRPFGEAALHLAEPKSGEHVLDVGCGCGDTTLELARAVGNEGGVLGLDISSPMLEVANRRALDAGLAQLSFRDADASQAELPGAQDLVFSRFGVMFFEAPVAAFAHLRGALREGGRLTFCCWQHPRENPWAMLPLAAARAALKIEAPPFDPLAPGPFAFAEAERLEKILRDAGYAAVEIVSFTASMVLGDAVPDAALNAVRMGPVSRLLREQGESAVAPALAAIETALRALPRSPRGVELSGATWMVCARGD